MQYKINCAVWVDDNYIDDLPFKHDLNNLREKGSHPHNVNNCNASNILLKSSLNKLNIGIHTQDFYIKRDIKPDLVIFFDIPTKEIIKKINYWKNIKKILILQECEVVRPINWNFNLHENFDIIFTWNSKIADNKKYFWFPTIHGFDEIDKNIYNFGVKQKTGFATLIASNKSSTEKNELYSERKKVIDWYEKNHSKDFDLYGYDWDIINIQSPIIFRIINRFNFKKKLFGLNIKNYKGEISSKIKTLEKYKFCFCYENALNINGYITEKIFDSFVAGTVPIYLGSQDIYNLVPENCFIDKRKFNSYTILHEYLSEITDDEYINFQKNINNFLKSEKAKKYTPIGYVEHIMPKIIENF